MTFTAMRQGQPSCGLNFGDFFSYALAESVREPLLLRDEDFARTDIDTARPVRVSLRRLQTRS